MNPIFANVDIALETLARGGLVILLDHEDRENEGDFVAAAELVTPSTIHTMTTHGRGIVCQSIHNRIAKRLGFEALVPSNDADATNFAMPVDAKQCHSGVSPADRVLTIRAIADANSKPDQFVRPGHMYPLIARTGGVLERAGHTEASVELMQLAGLVPSAVLCEICSVDGRNMAGLPELTELSRQLRVPLISVESLIDYRQSCDAELDPLESIAQARDDMLFRDATPPTELDEKRVRGSK